MSIQNKQNAALIFSVFIAGLCSIVYELLIATSSSYFLGDSITQFSVTIGTYMAAMGLGSFCSRIFNDQNLIEKFVIAEIILAVAGGFSVPLLYAAFAFADSFQLVSVSLTLLIGFLIGLEIPFLSRLLQEHYQLRFNISNVLSLDYFGALIATLLFPFLLLPFMGTFKTSLFFGLINLSIAFGVLWCFSGSVKITKPKMLWGYALVSLLLLGATFTLSKSVLRGWSNTVYTDRVIFQKETPYQNIVLTKFKDDIRLYLNGNLQFSSIDEYRYHEALVHMPMAFSQQVKHVLLLGGGDGLAVRELLKYDEIETITLVDLDPAITELAKRHPQLLKLNQQSLLNDKVTVLNQDGFVFLKSSDQLYDLVIVDLPDPNNVSLSRLYSREFYRTVQGRLSPSGVIITQATSPFFATDAFWCIYNTLKATPFAHVVPFHVLVPSFGDWGFVMASQMPLSQQREFVDGLRFLHKTTATSAFHFPKDIGLRETKINTIDQPNALQYYLQGWRYFN